jgi:hypothetical protein
MTESQSMKQPERSKPARSFTLDQEVSDELDEHAAVWGLSASAFLNMQLRMVFGKIDPAAAELLMRGMKRKEGGDDGRR